MISKPNRRQWLCLMGGLTALFAPACTSDGHFTIAGYTSAPNYRDDIKTIHVPIFKNTTFRRGLEVDLTNAVIREINQKTPYRVVKCDRADTELTGTIRIADKLVINRTQQNSTREAQLTLTVDLIWKDLRTGEVLSRPLQGALAPEINRALQAPVPLNPQGAPGGPVQPDIPVIPVNTAGAAPTVVLQSVGHYIPELGGSTATGFQQAINRMAVRIVSVLEKPW